MWRGADRPAENLIGQAQMACPIKFSAGLSAPRHIGAALGADTVAVLEGLGYSAERIAELKAAGAIA